MYGGIMDGLRQKRVCMHPSTAGCVLFLVLGGMCDIIDLLRQKRVCVRPSTGRSVWCTALRSCMNGCRPFRRPV
jgi:hypothetical protein